jgi:hypothetical protein
MENSPNAQFGNAISTGTLNYNTSRQPVQPTPKWQSFVQQNYHAAKNTSGLNHNQTMKSLGSNYRENKGGR